MSSGLQRRRGKQSSTIEESSGALEDGGEHKIAYDPNDISESSKGNQVPVLTLMEEVLLIGLKDKEGYLSFWNDNISYALRGLIILELAFRGKIRMVNDPARKRFEFPDRLIECCDGSMTGETLLDEALKLIKNDSQHMSVSNWIDLLSGETWNLMKINYQLKQVRERLAKGLVDKGVLKTERKNFLLFDMATHPIQDPTPKRNVISRILAMLTNRNFIIEYDEKYFPQTLKYKYLRTVCLVAGCCAANVLENILMDLSFESRDNAFIRADEILSQFSEYPFVNKGSSIGVGMNLFSEIEKEIETDKPGDLVLEVVAAVISVFSKMDSII
ncbi:hypothetical protein KL905_004959 [Ogataea polymorpha]|uniref:Vacuolar protein sorting-associated protein 74 n=1 Tax=Ogataea polymorpha TaxID=460523 RepID=A0A9P8PIP8_9ASCO|nr:hypothetical protein KL937_004973 [Ogataea polymorpha]KAG7886190.1 hypothetical protein KL936_005107 [Ogataea polymorpha]KAG7888655.1 hypothetical protein KL908_005015 [Ogataea polymorpha]KAG7897564.1 hypothetical protein KL935_004994 [Ogataea polymorpha]KAG7905359.1 hypothetical protein KL906_005214 [Ogataea polymorpha]